MNLDLETIREAVSSRTDEIIEWLKTLVRFPSENRPPRGREAEAQKFIENECKNSGWDVDVFSPDEIPGIQEHPGWLAGRNYDNGRNNIVARWKGGGKGKSILLSGHIDVAPFEPDDWKMCRPYEPIIKEGRLYGRGSADMKGGMAAAFWALRILQDLGLKPSGDILFESVVDEEFAGGNGTLAARLRGYNADLCVLPEPTRMEVCNACLGGFVGDLLLSGNPGMPFTGNVIRNPINGAARAIKLFERWQEKWRRENSHPLFLGAEKKLNIVLWHIESTNPGEFIQMGAPLFTKISWMVWCYPGMTENEFYQRFRTFLQEQAASDPELAPFQMELKPDLHYVKPWQTPVDNAGVQAVVRAFREYKSSAPAVGGAPFSCDLAVYGEVGRMPAVILGPRGDNLHAPDEWVEINDLLDLTGILANLIASWCGQVR